MADEPLLGLATTAELINELKTRMEMDKYGERPDPYANTLADELGLFQQKLSPDTLRHRTADQS